MYNFWQLLLKIFHCKDRWQNNWCNITDSHNSWTVYIKMYIHHAVTFDQNLEAGSWFAPTAPIYLQLSTARGIGSETSRLYFYLMIFIFWMLDMGLSPDMLTCGLRIRRECLEGFPGHRLQRKPVVSDADMHRGTCDTHVPRCMLGSLSPGGGEAFPAHAEPTILCMW